MSFGALVLLCLGVALGSYLIGGLMPALFLSKSVGHFDIREKGSGNAGTTNMLRSMGWKWAVVTFALDIAKGALPVLFAFLFFQNVAYAGGSGVLGRVPAYCAAAGVLLGHVYPVYFKFKGGKAVASSVGVMLVLNPLMTLIVFVVCLGLCFLIRRVSIASLVAFVSYAIVAFCFPKPDRFFPWFVLLLALFVVYLHRANIVRIVKGEEKAIVPGKGK